MPELTHFSREDKLQDICDAVRRDGACIIDCLLDGSLCNALNSDFLGDLNDMEWGLDELGYRNEFYGEQTKRLHGLFTRSSHMEAVLLNETVNKIAKHFLTENDKSHDIRLSNTELMVLGQGQKNQMFHTDGGSWHRVQQQEAGEILISANCALTNFTEQNGATRVVPGSHLWSSDRKPEASEICMATMDKGSALIYSGNVLHSGGANNTPNVRVGLYLGYIVSWLRPIENQMVTNEPKDIYALSASAQQMLDVVPGGFTVMA